MKKLLIFPILALFLFSCSKEFNDSGTKDQLLTPVENQEYNKGDTIYFTGTFRAPVMEFNSAFLEVTNLNTNQKVLDLSVGSEFTEKLVHDFDSSTFLKVKYRVHKEDAKDTTLIKEITIKCL